MSGSLKYHRQKIAKLTFRAFSPVSAHHHLEASFSKVSNLFGLISGATIPFTSSQRRGSKPSNFAIHLVFLTLKKCEKTSFSTQAGFQFDNWLFGYEKFSGFSRNRPLETNWEWFLYLALDVRLPLVFYPQEPIFQLMSPPYLLSWTGLEVLFHGIHIQS